MIKTLRFTLHLLVAASMSAALGAGEPRSGQRGKAPLPRVAPALVLRISARTPLRAGEEPAFKVTLTNHGSTPAVLVQPGDGSDVGWRTPLIAWSVLRADAVGARHPVDPPVLKGPRCGNINPLRPEEVIEIPPGATRELKGALHPPELGAPGSYRVVFYYVNAPAMTWSGVPDGTHDPEAMRRVKRSTPCSLLSKELVITREAD